MEGQLYIIIYLSSPSPWAKRQLNPTLQNPFASKFLHRVICSVVQIKLGSLITLLQHIFFNQYHRKLCNRNHSFTSNYAKFWLGQRYQDSTWTRNLLPNSPHVPTWSSGNNPSSKQVSKQGKINRSLTSDRKNRSVLL